MENKIIFTGPVGAGKTTAIASISEIPVVSTEALCTDDLAIRKLNTTVAMDYGMVNLKDNRKMHLFGTPGQERFNFMWDILTSGGAGLVLLIDNARDNPIADMEFFLDAFKDFIKKSAVVIGVIRVDIKNNPELTDFQQRLNQLNYKSIPVLNIDARKKQDVEQLLLKLAI